MERPPDQGCERDPDYGEDPETGSDGGHRATPMPPGVKTHERQRLQAEHRQRGLPDEGVQGQVLDRMRGVVGIDHGQGPDGGPAQRDQGAGYERPDQPPRRF